jgi:hypothetical protein
LEEIVTDKFILIAIAVAIVVTGCNLLSSENTSTPISTALPSLEFASPTPIQLVTSSPLSPATVITLSPSHSAQQAVIDLAFLTIAAIKNQDMALLAAYVHPQMNLRFSPYAYVSAADQIFPAATVANLLSDGTFYTWGTFSGSGSSIDLTFAKYYSQFIYDADFANAPQLSLNYRLGVSTSTDNIAKFYSGSMFVEFYFPGFDLQYEGMDWRSLRLVFSQYNDSWYLVGIVHDQWTI